MKPTSDAPKIAPSLDTPVSDSGHAAKAADLVQAKSATPAAEPPPLPLPRSGTAEPPGVGVGTRQAPQPSPEAPIGRDNEEVLALAFEGGAFDTVMQLGVVHALIAARRRPPDVVVGISVGAINAAALADVFQAGARHTAPGERQVAQFGRLRECLDAVQTAPDVLWRTIVPDGLEVNAATALEPVRLPIHFVEEREHRREAVEARAGMTQLMNHLFQLRVPFSVITIATRRFLGIRAAAEAPHFVAKWFQYLRESVGLWWLSVKNCVRLTPIVRMLLFAFVKGHPASTRGASARSIVSGTAKRYVLGALTFAICFFVTLVFIVTAPGWVLLIVFLRFGRDTISHAFKKERRTLWGRIRRRIFGRYGIADAFGQTHALRTMLVRYFDAHYYGDTRIEHIVDRALRRDDQKKLDGRRFESSTSSTNRRLLRSYRAHPSLPIHVAPIAARLDTGQLEALRQDAPIVDALLASTAFVPLFPPVALGPGEADVYIDGMNVANEPTSATIELLRNSVNPRSRDILVFPVSPMPVSHSALPSRKCGEFLGSVPVIRRVLQLRRFRDARLEYRLTRLFTRLLPANGVRTDITIKNGTTHPFVRAHLRPIEPEQSLDINERLAFAANEGERRQIILEAVADGCRATLERIIEPTIRGDCESTKSKTIPCARAIARLLGKPVPATGGATAPPGLPEVCEVCALSRSSGNGTGVERQLLRFRDAKGPDEWTFRGSQTWTWPDAVASISPTAAPANPKADATATPSVSVQSEKPGPFQEAAPASTEEAWTTLVFSGGVFRGVFQVGVLAGLAEAGIQPRLIAGASIGSIMGGMAANVLSTPLQETATRRQKLALVSATYMALDRLILTDRFADAVRSFTLRAAKSRFSLRDLDRVIRRYDSGTMGFGRRARRVLAGLERLVYLSPFEFRDWVAAARDRDTRRIAKLLQNDLQEFLARVGIGNEFLGAEPLALLIDELVLEGATRGNEDTFARFGVGDAPIDLIGVTTNLTQGRLQTIPESAENAPYAKLREGLLASAAFPFVFRPRRSWEIFTRDANQDQFVDGGVMDNLPLDAIAEFLFEASNPEGKTVPPSVPRNPQVPHRIIAASLEPEIPRLEPQDVKLIKDDWYLLWKRARTLNYNRKLERYAQAQRHLRAIYQHPRLEPRRYTPVNLEVVTVKPKWLCGTFAFHPMLGFRRANQAASIAHGCAMTLATLYTTIAEDEAQGYVRLSHRRLAQDFDSATIEPSGMTAAMSNGREAFVLKPATARRGGICWFRKTALCPFSREALAEAVNERGGRLPPELLREVPRIYKACGEWSTHAPR